MPAKVNPQHEDSDNCQEMNLTLRTTTKWRFLRISFRRTRKADQRSKALKTNNDTRENVMPIKILPTREEEEEERKKTVMTEDMQMFKNIIEMVLQKEGFRPM